MKNDHRDLEFLANKSNELLDRQVTSYRQKHSNSATIITVLALFIPFFLNGLENSYLFIKLLAIFPIALLVLSIILLIGVLRSKPLDQGFNVEKLPELVKQDYESILLYEIGANRCSFIDNIEISNNSNNKYNLAIKLTVIAIIISTTLLLTNEFFSPKENPKEVIITN